MVERVYGRMPEQGLGRVLERRLPPEPPPPPTAAHVQQTQENPSDTETGRTRISRGIYGVRGRN
jgi:hypothetical protein